MQSPTTKMLLQALTGTVTVMATVAKSGSSTAAEAVLTPHAFDRDQAHSVSAQTFFHRPLRLAVLSPGTTATHDIFNAFCMLGFPATHWDDTICSTHSPMLNTNQQCVFNDSDRMAGQPYGYYPYPPRMTNLLLSAAKCALGNSSSGEALRHFETDYGTRNTAELPSGQILRSDVCQISKWRSEFALAAASFHAANTSVADDPFHSPSLYAKTPGQPKRFDWLFVYTHRDPTQWARSRIHNHAEWVPVCDVRRAALAKMAQYDVSPLDIDACLRFCVEQGAVADAGRGHLGNCLTTVEQLGVQRLAQVFEDHTRVALKTAPAPVLELNLFSSPKRLTPTDISRKLQRFIVQNAKHSVPCPAPSPEKADDVEEVGDAVIEAAQAA